MLRPEPSRGMEYLHHLTDDQLAQGLLNYATADAPNYFGTYGRGLLQEAARRLRPSKRDDDPATDARRAEDKDAHLRYEQQQAQ